MPFPRRCLPARLCLLFLVILVVVLAPAALAAQAGSGVPAFVLNGTWEFHWQRTAAQLGQAGDVPVPLTLPAYWTEAGFPAEGFGTYRIRVALPNDGKVRAIRFGSVLTAYRVYVDGVLVGGRGILGGDTAHSVPANSNGQFHFTPAVAGPTEILVEVENYHYRKGGILDAPLVLDADQAQQRYVAAHATDLLLAGGLLLMALYHLGLWLFRTKNRSALWFSLFCVAVMLRFMVTGEYVMADFLPDFSWELGKKFEFLIFSLGSVPFLLFLSSLYPGVRLKRLEYSLIGVSFAIGLFVVFFPARITNLFVLGMEIWLAPSFAYGAYIVVRAVLRRLPGARLFVAGLAFLVIGAVNDVLVANQVLFTGYVMPLAFFAVIVLQSFSLSRNFAASVDWTERLSDELKSTNIALRRFIPQEFFRLLDRADIKDIALGDMVHAEMTIMFTDLRGFTALSEKMSPQDTFAFLNSFFGRMGTVVRKHGGFIDKYLGDGFLALYPDSPDNAMAAAVEIQAEIVVYNQLRGKSGYAPIELGIGIHYGRLTLGTVGEAGRMDTTVIADSVNLASRLEAMTKQYGKGIVVTLEFMDLLKEPDIYHWRYLGKVRVQGRTEAIEVVHVYDGLPQVEFQAYESGKAAFEEALAAYRSGELAAATTAFAAILESHPADRGSRSYFERIRFLTANGLPDDWDAVEQTRK
jgi:class 3 adenylate cyclase